MRLAEPLGLLLLIGLPVFWYWERRKPRLTWPTFAGFDRAPRGLAGWTAWAPTLLRTSAWACLVIALARPQTIGGQTRVAAKGVAIVAVLDRSGSMETADFPGVGPGETISRLEAARQTFRDFVTGRPDDLIGLVVFANAPDLACPPTLDHQALVEAARAVRPARAGEDGTNIGDALVWGLNAALSTSPRKKVLILLTDGRDRPAIAAAPPMAPEEAARLAAAFDVTLHAIALGRPVEEGKGGPTTDGPDLERLRSMARIARGHAFEASDSATLGRVFQELDRLERGPVQGRVHKRYREEFASWVAAALGLFALERLLSWTQWRRLP